MFMIESLAEVPARLSRVYRSRIRGESSANAPREVRGPVGLFLVRQDGAMGSKLAEEVVGSFKYWDLRSAQFFDGIFLGWGFDQGAAFGEHAFVACVDELERALRWKYTGGAHLLLTDFVYDVPADRGKLDFERVVPLDISALLEEKRLVQLGSLMEELVAPMRKQQGASTEASVLEISDYIALLRTRKFFWQAFIKKMGVLLGWADEIASYAVRDLRRIK